MSKSKPRIALLVGGTSPERQVSKMSGKGVLGALKNLQYPTKVIDPAYGLNQPRNEEDFFSEKDFAEISNRNCIDAINSNLLDDVDVVFSAMHGKWAEDGTIQSLLELRGLKYTGSKVLASALAMDKEISKVIFRQSGVQTPDWFSINFHNANQSEIQNRITTEEVISNGIEEAFNSNPDIESLREQIKKAKLRNIRFKNFDLTLITASIKQKISFPCVIKANDLGSTVGLKFVKDESEVEEGIVIARQYSSKVLIEKYIPGRELTVAVLLNEALPVLEIVPKSGLYDYASKYTSGMSQYIVPAEIPDEVAIKAQHQAMMAFNALGCEGYARVDFRLNNENELFCLEVNTLPGMTPLSLVPKAAKAVGISFEELIEKIIRQAL